MLLGFVLVDLGAPKLEALLFATTTGCFVLINIFLAGLEMLKPADGFEETYKKLGVSFDKLYFESDTYLLGKDKIEDGLSKDIFYKKDDGSVWIDLEAAKLDHKLVLRSDGTSVYMTQDIGTAILRYEDFKMDRMVIAPGAI